MYFATPNDSSPLGGLGKKNIEESPLSRVLGPNPQIRCVNLHFEPDPDSSLVELDVTARLKTEKQRALQDDVIVQSFRQDPLLRAYDFPSLRHVKLKLCLSDITKNASTNIDNTNAEIAILVRNISRTIATVGAVQLTGALETQEVNTNTEARKVELCAALWLLSKVNFKNSPQNLEIFLYELKTLELPKCDIAMDHVNIVLSGIAQTLTAADRCELVQPVIAQYLNHHLSMPASRQQPKEMAARGALLEAVRRSFTESVLVRLFVRAGRGILGVGRAIKAAIDRFDNND